MRRNYYGRVLKDDELYKVRDQKFLSEDGTIDWLKWLDNADENGNDLRFPIEEYTLKKGTRIFRFGAIEGKFAAPMGYNYEEVSMPYDIKSMEYNEFVLKEDILVTKGIAAPGFDYPGGAVQFVFKMPIKYYVERGMMKIKEREAWRNDERERF